MEADHRQERSNHMKRKLLLLSVLAICVATLAAGTLAYFSANGTARNVITTGNVSIAVEEWADADKTQPFEDLTGIMPGTTVTKLPRSATPARPMHGSVYASPATSASPVTARRTLR